MHYQHSCCINDHFAKILYNIHNYARILFIENYAWEGEKTSFNLLTWLVSILKHCEFFTCSHCFCYIVLSHIHEVQNKPKIQFIFSSLILEELEFFLHFSVIFNVIDSAQNEIATLVSIEIEIKWNILKACIKYVLHFIYDYIYINYCETTSWNSRNIFVKNIFLITKKS